MVTYPVHHGLTQVRLQGALAARLDPVQMLKRLNHCLLDDILRVGKVPGPRRQPSPGPSKQRRPAPGVQGIGRGAVAGPGPLEKRSRGIRGR
jgi:hypothetical protein